MGDSELEAAEAAGPSSLPLPAPISFDDMDDKALSQFIDEMMGCHDRLPESSHPDNGTPSPEEEYGVEKQVLMAALRRGFFSNEPVAVDISGKIDAEHGNRGIAIDPLQQMTNLGYLSAIVQSAESNKQARYKQLSRFPEDSLGSVGDELRALKEDDDVHSVSIISGGWQTNPDDFSPCAIDCWLKQHQNELVAPLELLPSLDTSKLAASFQQSDGEDGTPYSPLPSGHIRILCLEPGSYGEQVICSLFAQSCTAENTMGASAVKLCAYEALSYAWGDPVPRFSIQCNRQTLPVAHNLFLALHHLRDSTSPRYLWIDAISINQNDIEERSMQIRYMQDIYSRATRVVIWLGERSETSTLAVDSMKAFDQPLERRGVMFRTHERGCYEQLKVVCKAWVELLKRPWFSRAWIRQELMVARDAIVLCGRDNLSWYTLKRSSARLGDLRRKLSRECEPNEPEGEAPGRELAGHEAAISYLIRGWSYGQQVLGVIGCIRSIWYHHAGGLLELLISGRHFDATDPRDKVYAVLGLGQVQMEAGRRLTQDSQDCSNNSSFPIAYSKSVSEVYQDAVKYFINRDRNLDILTLLLTTRNADSATDLPSWVPDWRVSATEIPILTNWDFMSLKYAASGLHSKAELQRHSEGGVLRARGFIIDTIETPLDYTTTAHHLLSYAFGEQSEVDDDTGGGNREATLKVKQFRSAQDRARCFKTLHPVPSLAPVEARPGDDIAILFGAKHPYVVRVRSKSKSQLRKEDRSGFEVEHEIVGPCIHPRAMFGALTQSFAEHCQTTGLDPMGAHFTFT